MNKIGRHILVFVSIVLIVLSLGACNNCPKEQPQVISYEIVKIDSTAATTQDSAILKQIAPYKKILDDSMSVCLGTTQQVIEMEKPEGSLNHFAADAVLYTVAKKGLLVDMVLLNYGGLRSNIPAGNITVGNIYETFPFENEIVVLTLSGKSMQNLFDFLGTPDGHPIANVKLTYEKGKLKQALLGGKPFDINKNYTVATLDYLAAGNDHMDFFKNPIKSQNLNILLRDAVMDYVRTFSLKNKPVEVDTAKRILYE